MSGQVKRFHLHNVFAQMEESKSGRYVTFADHSAIVAAKDEEIARLKETLEDVLNQATQTREGWPHCDSMALSAYASGLRLMAELGMFVIESEYNRRVIGHWKQNAELEQQLKERG